jgi:hypothetical protein
MISVGVDVSRLGLMVVAGQPKNTAEYIQATSRVGRRFPGLVLTVFNWTRPRDISHYERFEHYHATFYQHVEALSVTPFAPRALDRGLSGVLVSQVRLLGMALNANDRAAAFVSDHPTVQEAVTQLIDRVAKIDGTARVELMTDALNARTDLWASRISASIEGARLGYQGKRDGQTLGLLSKPSNQTWTQFTCLNSLRNVEPSVNLILDEFGMDRAAPDAWTAFESSSENNGENDDD